MGPYVRTKTQDNSRPFVTRDVCFEVASRDFVFSQVSFFTVKGRIEPALLGMSLTSLGEVPRSVSRLWRVEVTRISD